MSHIVWTYELNRDVYQCYIKARENPKIGYMKRMKQYWDNLHPEFTNFNEKQLRQQATFVESKGLKLETNLQPITTYSNENAPKIPKHINTDVLNDDVIDITERENIDQNLLDEITVRFLHYFNVYEIMSLENRNFNTQVIYNIKDIELKVINPVITNLIENNLDKMSLWLINVIQYTAIVTILDRNNLLKYHKNIVKDKRTPNWQIHLQEKINNIRRKMSFITLITNS